MKNNCLLILILLFIVLILSGCAQGAKYEYDAGDSIEYYYNSLDNNYEDHTELNYIDTDYMDSMYLSLDNSSYAYTDIRNYINNGYDIPKNSVNIEEMLNYFTYDTTTTDDFKIDARVSECPWNTENLLETILITTPLTGERLPSNITFLVDVSGSMSGDTRLGLFKEAFEAAFPYFNESDRISLITYSSGVKTLLNGETLSNKDKILNKIRNLKSSGGTFASGGIKKAYKIAKKNFIEDGINHIFIVTDGDFNIGISNTTELGEMVKSYSDSKIYLSVFGVGMNNTKQEVIEVIKKNGEGNCYYLDTVKEGTKVLIQALKGGMKTIAKDTKAKITFNKEYVKEFRVIGYDNKLLTSEEYESDETNAGEISEGFQVVIAFEIVPVSLSDENISTIEIKYKDPITLESKVINAESINDTSDSHVFMSLVCEFGLVLKNSEYKGESSLKDILSRSENIKEYINIDDEKIEFIELVKKVGANIDTSHYYNK